MPTEDTEVTPVEELPNEEAHDTWPVKGPPSFITTPPPPGAVVLPPIASAPRAPDFSNCED